VSTWTWLALSKVNLNKGVRDLRLLIKDETLASEAAKTRAQTSGEAKYNDEDNKEGSDMRISSVTETDPRRKDLKLETCSQ
jgi:hypothetical protein